MLLRSLTILAVALPLFAQSEDTSSFRDALRQARLPLIVSDGKLGGVGGDVLIREIEAARFVLIGETHFTREIPEFATAVCQIMHPQAYAVEAGPLAAHYVAGELHDPQRIAHTQAKLRLEPDSIAFLNIHEENDLASNCAASSQGRPFHLWGLDQEYVGAAGMILHSMEATNPGPSSLEAIHTALRHEADSQRKASATGKVTQLYLVDIPDADLHQLSLAIHKDGKPETVHLLQELTKSHDIYRMSIEGKPESNHARAVLLKQHFLAEYLPFRQTEPEGRVLLKFGSMHMGRGFDPLHQLNLGNTVAEIADAEGVKSLHIAVVGAAGTGASNGGYRRPMQVEPFDLMSEKDEAGWLTPALEELLPPTSKNEPNLFTMFDLRKLRFRPLHFTPEWEQLIYSYDILVIIPRVSPAMPLQ
jgi:hypothetical protein